MKTADSPVLQAVDAEGWFFAFGKISDPISYVQAFLWNEDFLPWHSVSHHSLRQAEF